MDQAMIPYFAQPIFSLGPISLHTFGALVAIGIISATRLLEHRALRTGIDPGLSNRMAFWVLVGGFIGAHLVDRFIYFPEETLADPMSILRFWQGISSFGGFLGAVIGALLFVRRERLREARWVHIDAICYAFPLGWVFGRTGCFVAFDHPGYPTTFPLGMADATGVVRHNLGLEEALYTVFITVIVLWLGRQPRPPRFFAGVLCVLYAPVRFLMDYLRVVDVRYLGLTPGQYGAIALFTLGIFLLWRTRGQEVLPLHTHEALETEAASPRREI